MAEETKTPEASPAAATSPGAGEPAPKKGAAPKAKEPAKSPNPPVPVKTSGGGTPLLGRRPVGGGRRRAVAVQGRGIMSRKAYEATQVGPAKTGSHEAHHQADIAGRIAPEQGALRAIYACARERQKWAPGQVVARADFDTAIKSAGSFKISAR